MKAVLLRSGRDGLVEILISDQVQKLEGNREQADPEQVTHRGQVRDRRVIGIDLPFPHPVDHNIGDIKERRDLQHCRAKINEDEERRHRRVAVFNVID